MKIHIKVHVNSSKEEVKKLGKTIFEVWLKEKPTDGKANVKLIKLMKKQFKGKDVRIVSGFTGRKKLLEVIGD